MSDHVIYGKPVDVTEERLNHALAKQAKQKAFKDALDRQILEAERVKKEEARREKRRLSRDPDDDGGRAPAIAASPGSSPGRARMEQPIEERPPGGAGRGRRTLSASPTRYAISFAGEQANFTPVDVNIAEPPPPAQVAARRGDANGGATGGPSPPGHVSRARQPKRGAQPPVAEAPSRGVSPRDAKLAALAAPKNRRLASCDRPTGAPAGGRAAPPVYDSNSLPVNLDDYAAALGKRAAPGKPRGAGRPRPGQQAERVYDTQSLPVDLAYRLGKGSPAGAAPAPLPHPPWTAVTPNDQRRVGGLGAATRRGASPPYDPRRRGSPAIEGLTLTLATPSPDNYATGCLPRDYSIDDDFARHALAAKGRAAAVAAEARQPASSRSPPPTTSGTSAPTDLLTPTGRGRRTKDGRLGTPGSPGRPAGGVLPPIARRLSAGSDSTIEMSAVLDAHLGGHAPTPASAGRASNGRPPSDRRAAANGRTPSRDDASRPQKGLDARDTTVRRMQEKERSWEDQVQRLKTELRAARKQQRDLAKAACGGQSSGTTPPRAVTAPDPPSPSATHGGVEPRELRARLGAAQRVMASHESPSKPDFSRARVFTAESFRAITAPEPQDIGASPSHLFLQPGPRKQKKPPNSTGAALPLQLPAARLSTLGASEASLKLASLITRQTAFGLPEDAAETPAPIAYAHLLEFAEAQIITQDQADNLWVFFCGLKGVPVSRDAEGQIAIGCNADGHQGDDDRNNNEEDDGNDQGSSGSPHAARTDYHQAPNSVSSLTAVLAPGLRKKISEMQARRPQSYDTDALPPTRLAGASPKPGRQLTPETKKRVAGRPVSSRSPVSHSSDGAEDDDTLLSVAQSVATSKESCAITPPSKSVQPPRSHTDDTFDTSVELF